MSARDTLIPPSASGAVTAATNLVGDVTSLGGGVDHHPPVLELSRFSGALMGGMSRSITFFAC